MSGKTDLGLLILRIVVGAVFVAHGIAKLQGIGGTAGFFGSVGIPMPVLMAWVVALVETLGGAALILGIGTKIAALLLAVVMLVAIVVVKWSKGFVGGYEFELTLLAATLALACAGAGSYSADSKRKVPALMPKIDVS